MLRQILKPNLNLRLLITMLSTSLILTGCAKHEPSQQELVTLIADTLYMDFVAAGFDPGISAQIADRARSVTVASATRGATAIEYGLIAALIAIVIIGALILLGTQLTQRFSQVAVNSVAKFSDSSDNPSQFISELVESAVESVPTAEQAAVAERIAREEWAARHAQEVQEAIGRALTGAVAQNPSGTGSNTDAAGNTYTLYGYAYRHPDTALVHAYASVTRNGSTVADGLIGIEFRRGDFTLIGTVDDNGTGTGVGFTSATDTVIDSWQEFLNIRADVETARLAGDCYVWVVYTNASTGTSLRQLYGMKYN